MASWDDVRRLALALPEMTEEGGDQPRWRVRKKLVVWARPLREGDLVHLGPSAPSGPVLGVRTADLDTKAELTEAEGPVVFTTPHFDGYPSVLVRLDDADEGLLEELVTDAWLVQAPRRLAATWRAEHPEPGSG